MTIHRNHFAAAIASVALFAALPALADTTVPPDQTTTTTTTTVTKHRYIYYPEHDIYFAPESMTYYWNSNGKWLSGTTLPPEDLPYLRSRGISIELDADRPYERHDYVIAHYKNKTDHDDDRDQ